MRNSGQNDFFMRLSGVSEGLYFFERDLLAGVSRWSENAVRYFGLPPEYTTDTVGVWLPRIHPADRARYKQELDAVFSGAKAEHDCRYRVRNILGEYVWLECRGRITRDADGTPVSFDGLMLLQNKGNDKAINCLSLPEKCRAISFLETDMQAMAETGRCYGVLAVGANQTNARFEGNEQLAAILNVMDGAFAEKTIYKEGEETLITLVWGLDYASFSEKRKYIRDYIIDNDRDSLSYGYGWCEDAAELPKQVVVAYTYQKLMEQRMNSAAQSRYYALDKLTRIPQMEFFTQFAESLVQNKMLQDEFVFLYFNIDNFKVFNSEYGFEAGDVVLSDFAQLLGEIFPNYVTARMTSDRFLVLTNATNLEARITAVNQAVHTMQKGVRLEVKAGICAYTPDMTVSAACDNAKIACDMIMGDYSRTFCAYTKELSEKLTRQKYLADNLDNAIRQEYLKVYYQPIVRVMTGACCAMESLVRWDDPKYGFLNPGEFIPLLEKQGLIAKVDAFVLDRVCRDMVFGREMGEEPTPVSVNFSRKDFQLVDVYTLVTETVQKYGIEPRLIHIEVTESALTDNAAHLAETIARFQKAGFEVWLDDFGSEYSTLNVLQSFRFDVLKIDMKFFATAETSENARIIISSIVDMTKRLHTRVLAEGIETEGQFAYVKKLGIDKAQGFYMCRPMPIQALQGKFDRVETAEQARYYDDIGRVNCLSPNPLRGLEGDDADELVGSTGVASAIMRVHDDTFSYLYITEDMLATMRAIGIPSPEEAVAAMNDPAGSHHIPLLELARKCHESGKCESLDMVVRGSQLNLRAREIASTEHSRAVLVVLHNLSGLADIQKIERLNSALNFLYTIYGRVDLLDVTADRVENIYLNVEYYRTSLAGQPVRQGMLSYAEHDIAPEDREKFFAFYDMATLPARLAASKKKFLVQTLRTQRKNAGVGLQLYIIIPVVGEGERYLSCVRDVDAGIVGVYDSLTASDVARTADWYTLISRELEVGVLEWNLKENRAYASGVCYRYTLGHESMESILHNTASMDAVYPEDRPAAQRFFADSASGKARSEAMLRLKLVAGGYEWCRLLGMSKQGESGKKERIFGIIQPLHDFEDRRAGRLDFLNNVPDGVGIYEVENGVTRQTYMSEGFYRMLGDSREARLTRQNVNFMNNIYPDDRAVVAGAMADVIQNGKDFVTALCRTLNGNGEYKWIRMASRVARREDVYILVYCTYVAADELLALKNLEKASEQTGKHPAKPAAKSSKKPRTKA